MGSRLAWFPLYVDDWYGGTHSLAQAEHGAYLLALLQQWSSKDRQAIPNDPVKLERIVHGPFPPAVREKFTEIEIDGHKYLRNERLAKEWERANREHQAKTAGAKLKHTISRANAEHYAEQGTTTTTCTEKEKTGASRPPSQKKKLPLNGNGRPPDPYYEIFQHAFEQEYSVPYQIERPKDPTQLAHLKKAIAPSVGDWQAAVINYFLTPQSSHTLADLSRRYASFHKHPLDKYGKPAVVLSKERKAVIPG